MIISVKQIILLDIYKYSLKHNCDLAFLEDAYQQAIEMVEKCV